MFFSEGLAIWRSIMLSLIFVHSEVLLGKTVVQLDAKSEEKEGGKKKSPLTYSWITKT